LNNNPYIFFTRLDGTKVLNDKRYLLGSWCLDLKNKNWMQLKDQCLSYHWKDRNKFKKDFFYLENFKERLLEELVVFLNDFHKTSYPKRYWRIIIGPWLINFIAVIFDRWEIIKSISNNFENFDTHLIFTKQEIPKDFFEFRNQLDDDLWNHVLFSEILKFQFPDNNFSELKIINQVEKNIFKKQFGIRRIFIKDILLKFISFLEFIAKNFYKFVGHKKRFAFYESGLNKKFFFKIILHLRTLPMTYGLFRKEQRIPKILIRNQSKIRAFKAKNEYEDFISSIIFDHMPIAYLEGYKKIEKESRRQLPAKIIVTGFSYWYNEFFKIWTAQQILENSKLIILEHGGSFQLSMNQMNHLEDIADIKTSWGIELNQSQKRLAPNKLSIVRKRRPSTKDQITMFDYESVRFSYRAVGAPIGPLVLEEHLLKLEFIELLPHDIRKFLKIKPKYLGSWNFEDSYSEIYGQEIISKYNDLNSIIQNSRLLISGYPQTTFSEGMFSGVPTILLFKEHLWEINEVYSSLITDLKEKQIIHNNANSAVKHIKNILGNEMDWWNSEEIIESRQNFNNLCNTISDNPAKEWSSFFKGIEKDMKESEKT